jgi:hypothetical protein
MALPPPSVWTDGEWLAHRYEEQSDAFHLRHLTREAHDAATFITDEYLGEEQTPLVVPRREAMANIRTDHQLHFILHSAFCASTMLARGFDLPGVSMGLKEPVILNDITGWRRRGAAPAAVAERLDHALHMLARPFAGDQAVIAKPSNVFNALAPLALAMRPTSRAVLLHAPLPVFLLSVARKGLWCRLWCRELLEGLLTDTIVDLGFEPRDYFRQSDLQVAAVGWLAQHRLFAQLFERFGPDRIATLDSESLTASPAATLEVAAAFFGLDLTGHDIASHRAFSTHSKFGQDFATADRAAEYAEAQRAYGDEIDQVVIWAEAVAQSAGIALELPGALLQRA